MFYEIEMFFVLDNGQTKPKPRSSKKGEASKAPEQIGESRCLFRATNGKRKISTVVCDPLQYNISIRKVVFSGWI